MDPYVVKKIMKMKTLVFGKDNNYHKQKEEERHNPASLNERIQKVRRL